MRTGNIIVAIKTNGYIPEVNRQGPIGSITLPSGVVYNLIRKGHKLMECDPIDTRRRVDLTLANFNDEHKFVAKKAETPAPVVKVEPAKPVAPTAQEVEVAAAIVAAPAVAMSAEEETAAPTVANEAPAEEVPHLSRKQRKALARQQAAEAAAQAAMTAEESVEAAPVAEDAE